MSMSPMVQNDQLHLCGRNWLADCQDEWCQHAIWFAPFQEGWDQHDGDNDGLTHHVNPFFYLLTSSFLIHLVLTVKSLHQQHQLPCINRSNSYLGYHILTFDLDKNIYLILIFIFSGIWTHDISSTSHISCELSYTKLCSSQPESAESLELCAHKKCESLEQRASWLVSGLKPKAVSPDLWLETCKIVTWSHLWRTFLVSPKLMENWAETWRFNNIFCPQMTCLQDKHRCN